VQRVYQSQTNPTFAVEVVIRSEGKPIAPLAEVEVEVNVSDLTPAFEAAMTMRDAMESDLIERGMSRGEYLKRLNMDLLDTNDREDSHVPEISESRAPTVHFTISGTLDVTALSALTKSVELLRENGEVRCDVELPSRITL
jgi:hypothetical protein